MASATSSKGFLAYRFLEYILKVHVTVEWSLWCNR